MNKILFVLFVCGAHTMTGLAETRYVDYRFAPKWFYSFICFPDDSFKSLVGADGQLLYDYGGKGKNFPYACNTRKSPNLWGSIVCNNKGVKRLRQCGGQLLQLPADQIREIFQVNSKNIQSYKP